jgi:hypothetical protein
LQIKRGFTRWHVRTPVEHGLFSLWLLAALNFHGGIMAGRRKFLKSFAGASAGFCFVNCGLQRVLASAQQPDSTVKRRQISIGGRRLRTIDIHAHCYVDLRDLLQGHPEALIPNGGPPTFDGPFLSPTKDVEAATWTSTESISRP